MKTIGKDGILLRLAKDMYPERDDLTSIEVKTLFNDICPFFTPNFMSYFIHE